MNSFSPSSNRDGLFELLIEIINKASAEDVQKLWILPMRSWLETIALERVSCLK